MEQKSLTIESIVEAVEKCKAFRMPDGNDLFGGPSRLFGMDIIEAPGRLVPKIKLGDAAPVSDKFRAEFDAWLVQMFGTRDVSYVQPGMAYMFGNKILMRPEAVVRLNCCV